ncbi:hypothetical protein JIN85_17875 [Luteolibacter pohnpeiensis]|uniref:Uncharacterized protein n=1 Tax=Luteolibacter pohnpeiensis TaxID=454153 RepID=A0A934S9H5_9BACT|nr:hypothetical protein [Luteolibacter pohnpeiensis]MBK1884293.1 hypothetical protein [Luteolibacter pohnpeiensis]
MKKLDKIIFFGGWMLLISIGPFLFDYFGWRSFPNRWEKVLAIIIYIFALGVLWLGNWCYWRKKR